MTQMQSIFKDNSCEIFFQGLPLNLSREEFLQEIQMTIPEIKENHLETLGHLLQGTSGPFALAIHHENGMILARDPFGQIPLYYRQGEKGRYAFSSSLTQLHQSSDQLNHNALGEYLRYGYIPAPDSPWQEIAAICPGQILIVDTTGKPQKSLFYANFRFNHHPITKEAALTRIEELLTQAIHRCQQAAKREFGVENLPVLLSGGIDSTLLFFLSQAKDAVTIQFPENQSLDESRLAALSVQKAGARHHLHAVTQNDVSPLLETTLKLYGEPFANSSLIATTAAFQEAAKLSPVVLCGDGGDEIFGGYRRYQAAALCDKIPHCLHGILGKLLQFYGKFSLPAHQKCALLGALLSLTPQEAYLTCQKYLTPQEISQSFPEFALSTSFQQEQNQGRPDSLLDTMNLQDLYKYLPEDGARKLWIASMASSCQPLCPFLDMDLVNFALSLPQNLRTTLRKKKPLLHALLVKYAPPELLTQPKRGFAVPLQEWTGDARTPSKSWCIMVLKRFLELLKSSI